MSKRAKFIVGEYYHIFNRGTDKRIIFNNDYDLTYFIDSIFISNQLQIIINRHSHIRNKNKKKSIHAENLISIVAYCFLPNHFHLIVKELTKGSISKFMQKLGTSYTLYFNKKYDRNGVLFQGKFKATLLHELYPLELATTYVNLNYKYHKIDPKTNIVKTSLFEFLGNEINEYICNKNEVKNIIKTMGGIDKYKQYMKDQSQFFADEKNINFDKLKFTEFK